MVIPGGAVSDSPSVVPSFSQLEKLGGQLGFPFVPPPTSRDADRFVPPPSIADSVDVQQQLQALSLQTVIPKQHVPYPAMSQPFSQATAPAFSEPNHPAFSQPTPLPIPTFSQLQQPGPSPLESNHIPTFSQLQQSFDQTGPPPLLPTPPKQQIINPPQLLPTPPQLGSNPTQQPQPSLNNPQKQLLSPPQLLPNPSKQQFLSDQSQQILSLLKDQSTPPHPSLNPNHQSEPATQPPLQQPPPPLHATFTEQPPPLHATATELPSALQEQTVPQGKPPLGIPFEAIWCSGDSPLDFHVQSVASSDTIEKLIEEVSRLYGVQPFDTNYRPQEGDMVAALWEGTDRDTWYRGEVMVADRESLLIRYVDYGMKGRVSIRDARKLISHNHHPHQAIKCRLMDTLAPNEHRERDIAFFKTQMGRGPITITPHTYCDEEYSVSVRLSTGEDLGDLLQQTDQFSHEPPEIEERKVEIGSSSIVEISHFVSADEFYVVSRVDTFNRSGMCAALSNIRNNSPSLELIEEGYVVVAPRKGIPHRARVTDSTSATTLTVQYVDIGDSATLPRNDVRILPEMFANEPAFAVRCHIDVIPSTTSAQLRQFIKTEHPDDLAMCKFVRKVSGFGYEVEIRSTDGGSTLAAKLQAHGFVQGSSQQPSLSRSPLTQQFRSNVRRPNHDLPDERPLLEMTTTSPYSLPLNHGLSCTAVCVNSPFSIYLRFKTKTQVSARAMEERVNVRGRDGGVMSFSEMGLKPRVNELLIWKGEDGNWHRGIALDDQGLIFAPDCGSTRTVPLNNLKPGDHGDREFRETQCLAFNSVFDGLVQEAIEGVQDVEILREVLTKHLKQILNQSTSTTPGFVWVCESCLGKFSLETLTGPGDEEKPPPSATSLRKFSHPTNETFEEEKEEGEGKKTDEDQSPTKIEDVCTFYLRRKCRHGRYGTKKWRDTVCPKKHPELCKKYSNYGTTRHIGCNRGTECKYFHPPLCRSSEIKRKCFKVDCQHQHLKHTDRYDDGEWQVAGQRNRNHSGQGQQKQQNRTGDRSRSRSRNRNPSNNSNTSNRPKENIDNKGTEDFFERLLERLTISLPGIVATELNKQKMGTNPNGSWNLPNLVPGMTLTQGMR
eukprot:sb/3461361/